MGKVIGIVAVKGGVGKTTISASLASELANHFDKKVLLVDANYSAPNVGLHMDIVKPEKTVHDLLSGRMNLSSAVHHRFGVDVVPGSYFFLKKFNPLKLKDRLKQAKKQYDFIILDSSPTLNDELLSTVLASDHIFLVSTPDYPTLSCTFRAMKLAKQRDKKIQGVILNKISNPDYEISLEDVEEILGLPVVAKIPEDGNNLKALYNRIPTSLYNRKSKFAKEINKLCSALANSKEKKHVLKHILPLDLRKEEVNRELLKKTLHDGLI
jgi:pilus assembly protein CpaE